MAKEVDRIAAMMEAEAPAPSPSGSNSNGDRIAAMMGAEPSGDSGQLPTAAPAPKGRFSPLETAALEATNVFGAGPAISGALQSLIHGRKYSEARDEYKRAIEEASQENPKAALAGKGGALVAETILGGGVGKAAAAGAKIMQVGRAGTVAGRFAGSALGKGVVGGAGYGAASGAGAALSSGEDVLPAALEGAGYGAALGGAIGAGAGALGKAFSKAPAAQAESIVRGAAERSLPRNQRSLAKILNEEAGAGRGTKLTGQDVVLENTKILKKARSSNPDDIVQVIDDVKQKTLGFEEAKARHYGKVDAALGGGIEAKTPVEMLRSRASTEKSAPWRKVLLGKADELEAQFATIPTDAAKAALHAAKVVGDQGPRDAIEAFAATLPPGGSMTKGQLLDHLVGGDSSKMWADINPDIRKAVEALPFRYDGLHRIPARELRAILTVSQEEAASALGTLNATTNAKLAGLSQEVLGLTMHRSLEEAKRVGGKDVAKAVQEILDTNKRQSTLLKLNEALASKLDKLTLGKLSLGQLAGKHAPAAFGGFELLNAGHSVMSGDTEGAGKHLALAAAAKGAPGALRAVKHGAIDTMSMLAQKAAAGNARAQRLLKSLEASKRIGTAGAGAVGAIRQGSLAAEQGAP